MYIKFNADLLLFSLNGAGIEIQKYLVWKKRKYQTVVLFQEHIVVWG
jgi:hypothetical protein